MTCHAAMQGFFQLKTSCSCYLWEGLVLTFTQLRWDIQCWSKQLGQAWWCSLDVGIQVTNFKPGLFWREGSLRNQKNVQLERFESYCTCQPLVSISTVSPVGPFCSKHLALVVHWYWMLPTWTLPWRLQKSSVGRFMGDKNHDVSMLGRDISSMKTSKMGLWKDSKTYALPPRSHGITWLAVLEACEGNLLEP